MVVRRDGWRALTREIADRRIESEMALDTFTEEDMEQSNRDLAVESLRELAESAADEGVRLQAAVELLRVAQWDEQARTAAQFRAGGGGLAGGLGTAANLSTR